MRDASGHNRIRYADTFRAIGNYLDVSVFRDLTLVETPDGFIITGLAVTTTPRSLDVVSQSLLVTDEDLDVLIQQAFVRRGTEVSHAATLPSVAVGDHRVRYEDVLRRIGELIDARDWHAVVVVQTGQGFQLKGHNNDTAHDTFLDAAALRERMAHLEDQRHPSEPSEPGKRRLWPRSSSAKGG